MRIFALLLGALLAAAPALAQDHMQVNQAKPVLAGSTTVPFRLYGNHIYVRAAVGGKTFAFVFDTGGGASLSAQAQQHLKLPVVAQAQINGIGNSTEQLSVVSPSVASLGEARIEKAYFLVLPPAIDLGSPFPELSFGGVLGREFFARLMVTIDYAHQTLTLTNPAVFHADAAAASLPLTMRGGLFPNVKATVDGVEGSFDIDAGSPHALILNQSFAGPNGIVAKMPRTVEATPGQGVGGLLAGVAGRVATLGLGGFTLDGPVAYVVRATGGAFEDAGLAGNIGTDVLRRFTVTLDVPDKLLYLAKNAKFDEPFPFTRAGIFAERRSGAIVIVRVIPESPAQQAGVRAGDTLIAIDGRSVASLGPDEIKNYWTMPAGTVIRVDLRRDGNDRWFDLKLRDLL